MDSRQIDHLLQRVLRHAYVKRVPGSIYRYACCPSAAKAATAASWRVRRSRTARIIADLGFKAVTLAP
jgi:hypothetical protein